MSDDASTTLKVEGTDKTIRSNPPRSLSTHRPTDHTPPSALAV